MRFKLLDLVKNEIIFMAGNTRLCVPGAFIFLLYFIYQGWLFIASSGLWMFRVYRVDIWVYISVVFDELCPNKD